VRVRQWKEKAEAAEAEAAGARKIAGDYADLFEAAEAKLDAAREAWVGCHMALVTNDRMCVACGNDLREYGHREWCCGAKMDAALADEPEAPVQHQEYGP
jgi:hypothetical protein